MRPKIVVGYDGSAESDDAIVLGRALADVTAAQPVVVAAEPWPTYLKGSYELEQAVHAHLDPLLRDAAERLSGLNPQTRAVFGRSVASELMDAAEREQATAIVVGASHHSAAGRIALGSVGNSLVHGAPCAVAVAPRGFNEADGGRLLKIGVAFDGSDEARSALETAIGFAERTHGSLSIITCADLPIYGLSAALTVYTAGEMEDFEMKEKERILELGLEQVPAGLPAEGRVLSGPPARLIPEVSSAFDLLLIGSRGYGPIGRTFLGGVATHVIHSARCPVMVMPRSAGLNPFGVAQTGDPAQGSE